MILPKLQTTRITPFIAASMLINNTENRRLDPARVAKYHSDMTSGFWVFNGDPIRFDNGGNLIDGQHRLAAIVKSNLTFDFLVVEGLDRGCRKTIDTGKVRSPGDALHMFSDIGTKHSSIMASSIIKIMLYEKGLTTASGGNMGIVSNSSVESFYHNNSVKLDECLGVAVKLTTGHAIVLGKSQIISLYYILSKIDEEEALQFLSKLATGFNIEVNSNEALLRSILVKNAMKSIKVSPLDLFYTVIKGWNKNRKGGCYSNEGNLRTRKGDGFKIAIS
jgi:hypothetical protein